MTTPASQHAERGSTITPQQEPAIHATTPAKPALTLRARTAPLAPQVCTCSSPMTVYLTAQKGLIRIHRLLAQNATQTAEPASGRPITTAPLATVSYSCTRKKTVSLLLVRINMGQLPKTSVCSATRPARTAMERIGTTAPPVTNLLGSSAQIDCASSTAPVISTTTLDSTGVSFAIQAAQNAMVAFLQIVLSV